MAEKIKPKFLGKNPFVGKPFPIKVNLPKAEIPKIMRVPRGPTTRWSIDYNKLFKKKK